LISPKPDPARRLEIDPALLNACDREPIHIPGSIQPHGLLLVADADLRVVAGAGAIEERLTPGWLGRHLSDLLGCDIGAFLSHTDVGPGGGAAIGTVETGTARLDATLRRSGAFLLAELEPSSDDVAPATDVLARLDAWATSFERSTDLRALCERAAVAFREVTGFARVMIYRFLDDEAGEVIAEDRDPALGGFLNHHFPASDIPRQARALYVRNRIRVIPDVSYVPQPIRPGESGLREIDLSDASLRSVSPVHVQYLKNMGVQASASVSIVKDNVLWGLVACHNDRPRRLALETRIAAQALAGSLARQIKAREDAEILRERYRLRADGETLLPEFDGDAPFGAKDSLLADELRRMFGADGFAHVGSDKVTVSGVCPPHETLRRLARWIGGRVVGEPFSTFELSREWPAGEAIADVASGLLAVNLGGEDGEILLWFRAEEVQIVNWAGNPHKAVRLDPNATLSPRSSFEAWSETVRGRARPWTLAEVEAAGRLRRGVVDIRQARHLRDLNRRLASAISEKDGLLAEKDFLIKEVNHRVQNSLQLVSAFLGVQGRSAGNPEVTAHLKEAQRRLSAVALVHRRLYRSDSLSSVDLSRYLEELCGDMKRTMGGDWAGQMSLDMAPMLVSADRAVTVGLVLTELVINATKYAYEGRPGPLAITLDGYRNRFRLVVADRGGGKPSAHEGFGTQMMRAMVDRLSGTIEYADNDPGLRVIVVAPLDGQTRDSGS
jgi:light-regulated signal transduction histidine kinase (bacteriophytochrome)